ncbi:MAG: alpha/beta hydrolase [Wenzhouxiangella sp.]|jgi:acetyl esterase/lipase|nr:alpha/beta hydrolase [Wenzhouxiangella sp.]
MVVLKLFSIQSGVFLATLIWCAAAFADGQASGPVTWPEVLAQQAGPADLTVAYGAHPDQFGELRLPDAPGPHRVVVLIHGGCWLPDFDLVHVRPLAEAITALGLATWTIEYRRPAEGEQSWPNTFTDAAAALDKLRDLRAEYALNLDSVTVMGHSAGGQLALWLAARPTFAADHPLVQADPLPVQRVLALAPITDMVNYAQANQGCPLGARRVVGGLPDDYPERYRAVSPLANLAPGVRTDVVHAIEDRIVPILQSTALVERLNQLEGRAELHKLPAPAGHFDVLMADGEAWELIAELLTE